MKNKVLLILVILLLLQGCNWKSKQDEESKSESTGSFTAKMPVTVSPSKLDTLTVYIYATGTLKVARKAEIVSEISGKIAEIFVEEHEVLKENDIIARVDISEQLWEQKRLNLEREKAQKELSAWKTIDSSIDDEQLEIRTGLKDIEISLEKLQLQIEKASIKAPFAGTISEFDLEKGMFVSSGTKICSLYDLGNLVIDVRILESEISKIKVGQPVVIQFPARKNKLYYGKVESIAPFIAQNSRTCEVRVKLHNDGVLREGMYAEVKIGVENHKERILIVKEALLIRDGKKLVFVAESEKAKWQYVKTGLENKYLLEITEGINPKQLIIINGHFSLSHDANIEVKETVSYEDFESAF
jgi:RND family efflux transporter MFP subunit